MTDRDAARLALAAYLPAAGAAEAASRLGYETEDLSSGDTECYGFTRHRELVVVFRGTDSVADWVTDMKSGRQEVESIIGKVEVHGGFVAHLARVWEALSDRLTKHDGVIYMIGHSLGGACAQLAAYRARVCGLEVARVVTFGGPRVGNQSFADAYDSSLGPATRRYRRALDPVPTVPTKRSGFAHTMGERYIDRHGRVHERIGFLAGAYDRLALLTWRRRWDMKPEFLSAHAMRNYENDMLR